MTERYEEEYFSKRETSLHSRAIYAYILKVLSWADKVVDSSAHDGQRRMLDVGCGYGFVVRFCSHLGFESIGIDISRHSIFNSAKSLSLFVSDVNALPFQSDTFDMVTAFDVVEHIHDRRRMLSEVKRVLKRGGIFVGALPVRHPINHVSDRYHGEYHFDLPSVSGLVALFSGAGFVDVNVRPFIFIPFTRAPFLGRFHLLPIPYPLARNVVFVCRKN
jgi:SAM-dependent methyltransferase